MCFLIFKNKLFFSLCPFPLILLQATTVKSLALPSGIYTHGSVFPEPSLLQALRLLYNRSSSLCISVAFPGLIPVCSYFSCTEASQHWTQDSGCGLSNTVKDKLKFYPNSPFLERLTAGSLTYVRLPVYVSCFNQ